jgi:hypothetical protein
VSPIAPRCGAGPAAYETSGCCGPIPPPLQGGRKGGRWPPFLIGRRCLASAMPKASRVGVYRHGFRRGLPPPVTSLAALATRHPLRKGSDRNFVHDVDIAVGPVVAVRDRSEQRSLLQTGFADKAGQRPRASRFQQGHCRCHALRNAANLKDEGACTCGFDRHREHRDQKSSTPSRCNELKCREYAIADDR